MEGKKDDWVCVCMGGWGVQLTGAEVRGGWVAGGGVSLGFKDLACSPIFHTTVTS